MNNKLGIGLFVYWVIGLLNQLNEGRLDCMRLCCWQELL